jgi:hypothetical protein
MPFTKDPDSFPITRILRREKRKVVSDVFAATIKLSAALQDMRDSTARMKAAYLSGCDLESAAVCDRILNWLPSDADLDPRVNKRNVKTMLSVFTKLRED